MLLVTNILGMSIRASSVLDRDDGMLLSARYGYLCNLVGQHVLQIHPCGGQPMFIHCASSILGMVEGGIAWQPYR